LHLFAITNPHEPIVQAQVSQVRAPVEYLEDSAKHERAAVLAEHAWAEQQAPDRYVEVCSYVEQSADLDDGYTSASRYECFDYAVHLTGLLASTRDQHRNFPSTLSYPRQHHSRPRTRRLLRAGGKARRHDARHEA
jgi:hypothetical protein